MFVQPRLLATMVTTTSYGAWLPGDIRGYVDNGIILPGDPQRLELAIQRMSGRSVVLFSTEQQQQLFEALCVAANEFHYKLTDASVESWHLHWIIEHGFDSVATMVGRLKNRMRQALNIARIWNRRVLRLAFVRMVGGAKPATVCCTAYGMSDE